MPFQVIYLEFLDVAINIFLSLILFLKWWKELVLVVLYCVFYVKTKPIFGLFLVLISMSIGFTEGTCDGLNLWTLKKWNMVNCLDNIGKREQSSFNAFGPSPMKSIYHKLKHRMTCLACLAMVLCPLVPDFRS